MVSRVRFFSRVSFVKGPTSSDMDMVALDEFMMAHLGSVIGFDHMLSLVIESNPKVRKYPFDMILYVLHLMVIMHEIYQSRFHPDP